MLSEVTKDELFCRYYAQWIRVYKEGAIRKVTMDKYLMTQAWLEKLVPNLKLCGVTRMTYQQLLNDYAAQHERQTTMDFHHQLKAAILDAVDDGMIERDPTRKAIIKGKSPTQKKIVVPNTIYFLQTLSKKSIKFFTLLLANGESSPYGAIMRFLRLHRRTARGLPEKRAKIRG